MLMKRGEMKRATTMILFVVAFFSVALIFSKGVSYADERTGDEVCRLSVLARINSQGLTGTSPIALDCPRKNVVLYEEGSKFYHSGDLDIDINKIPIRQYEEPSHASYKSADKGKLMKFFADEYAECWYKMGEGDLNVFNPPSGYPLDGFETTCMICSDINFDASFRNLKFTLNDFEEFMKKERYQRHGKDELYYDYLYQDFAGFRSAASYLYTFNTFFEKKAGSVVPQTIFNQNDTIDTSESYVIFFERVRFNPTQLGVLALGVPVVGMTVGAPLLFSPSEDNYFVFFAPASKLPEVCGVMVN